MSVDWFTVGAQAINFLVLLWLMKRFLYKPILKAIDERDKQITAKMASAEADKIAAEKQKVEYDQKNEELNQQRAGFLKSAQDEAQTEKLRLLKEAQQAAEAYSEKRQESLEREEDNLSKDVSSRVQAEVLLLTRKLLTELAGASLEEQVVLAFIQRLRDMDTLKKDGLVSAVENDSEAAIIRTAFELSPQLQKNTEQSIKEILGSSLKLRFESSADVISGIELTLQGQKLAWSIAEYLSSLAEDYSRLALEHAK